jgi:hypothetical protein
MCKGSEAPVVNPRSSSHGSSDAETPALGTRRQASQRLAGRLV